MRVMAPRAGTKDGSSAGPPPGDAAPSPPLDQRRTRPRPSRNAARLNELEKRLGHRFANRALIEEALTHSSAGADSSNERLEFLGDRVLGLIIAEALLERYPNESEGALAPRFNALVRKETCAAVGRELGLADALTLAESERLAGGHLKSAILADACEAVIAALYLDAGFEAAKTFVIGAWASRIEVLGLDMRDAKTALQEWAQSSQGGSRGTPHYEVIERTGPDHAPHFKISVRLPGLASAEGEGASKREAEQAAARAMLQALGLITVTDDGKTN
jgi:ribonuclease III